MEQTQPIIDYRIRVITTGLIVSWLGMVLFAIWSVAESDLGVVGLVVVLSALFIGLVLLTIAPWRRLLDSQLGDWFLVIWSVIALAVILFFEVLRPESPGDLGFVLVTFFAAATLIPNRPLIAIGIASTTAYGVALVETGPIDAAASGASMLAFAGAILFVLLVSVGVRAQLEQTAEAYDDMVLREAVLTKREREMSQLYDISRTIRA